MSDYPNLEHMTDEDLVLLLALYVKGGDALAAVDAEFIKAIQAELKQRSGNRRLSLGDSRP